MLENPIQSSKTDVNGRIERSQFLRNEHTIENNSNSCAMLALINLIEFRNVKKRKKKPSKFRKTFTK